MAPTRWSVPLRRASSPHQQIRPATEHDIGGSDIDPDEALHSTAQFDARHKAWVQSRNARQSQDQAHVSEDDESISIEIGRGLGHQVQGRYVVDSSQVAFAFGNDSQYEMTGTPPTYGINTMKTASRRANDSAKRSASQTAHVLSNLSEKIRMQADNVYGLSWEDEEQATASLSARNTRFGHARRVTSTVRQSASIGRFNSVLDTADSFQLPDISGIEELVRGKHNREPATSLRTALSQNRQRSVNPNRLNSTSDPNPATDRLLLESVPIPEDEKRIYSSLQHLRDRIAELESENMSARAQVDHFQDQVTELRSALTREEQLRRPDSALGSDDETEKDKWRLERTKLQASLRAVRQQLDHAQHKNQQLSAEARQKSTERDTLISQLGIECLRLKRAEFERQHFQGQNTELKRVNVDLHEQLEKARQQLSQLGVCQLGSTDSEVDDRATAKSQSRKPITSKHNAHQRPSTSAPHAEALGSFARVPGLDQEARQCIANTVQKQFDRLLALQRGDHAGKAYMRKEDGHSHSQCCEAQAETTATRTEFEITGALPQIDDANLTELSQSRPDERQELRKMLERVRLESHGRRQSSAPATVPYKTSEHYVPEHIVITGSAPKSAFKRTQSGRHHSQGAPEDSSKAIRSVRVQSPTSGEPGNGPDSTYGGHADPEGDTSDIIMPDITLHRSSGEGIRESEHDAPEHLKHSCTVCNSAGDQAVDIPIPEYVSLRSDLPDDATLRPSQAPFDALAMVLKHLKDEKEHLGLALAKVESQYHAHDPAVGKRTRLALHKKASQLRGDCERKDEQIYALFDALEAHNNQPTQRSVAGSGFVSKPTERPMQNAAKTLLESARGSRIELGGHTNQGEPALGLDGANDGDDLDDVRSIDLPDWDGLSAAGF